MVLEAPLEKLMSKNNTQARLTKLDCLLHTPSLLDKHYHLTLLHLYTKHKDIPWNVPWDRGMGWTFYGISGHLWVCQTAQ